MPLIISSPRQFDSEPVFLSPDVASHQGYATDGRWHFTFDTGGRLRRDEAWTAVATNRSPFVGTSGVDHLGDGDHYRRRLYVPAAGFSGCGSFGNQRVFVFDATTLAREEIHDISAFGHEASAIAVDGLGGVLYVSSFCDGLRLFRYDLSTFAFTRVVDLSTRVPEIQGLTFRDGFLYATSDSQRTILAVDPRTGAVTEALRVGQPGSFRGTTSRSRNSGG